jgi:DNA-binding response OmpR family regulator
MSKAMNNAGLHRILVVDDASANLLLLTNLLTGHGYTVHPASDGELALEFVQSILPDLILLDIRMPGMDGYEICRRLKADERTRSIPIIFISILEDEYDKVKGFQAGGVDYITKPFQPEEVLARVRTHLSLRELAENLEQKVIERTEELMIANERLQREIAEREKADQALHLNAERMETLLRLNQMTGATMDEITSFAFEAAVKVTRSKLGYLAFMKEDETVLNMQLWSREAMAECNVPGSPRI